MPFYFSLYYSCNILQKLIYPATYVSVLIDVFNWLVINLLVFALVKPVLC